MSSRSPTRPSDHRCPTEQDLDHLSQRIRDAARNRGLSEETLTHYEQWIFLFLSWCLKVPPFDVDRNRMGDFWSALTQRQVSRWKVCQAMDALGFFFGSLSEASSLSWAAPAGPSAPSSLSDTTVTGLRSPLPEGALPDGVDARAAVPTRSASPSPEAPDDPPSFWNLIQTDDEDAACDAPEDPPANDTASLDLPRALANRIKTLAARRGVSPEALIRHVLENAWDEDSGGSERPRPQRAMAHS